MSTKELNIVLIGDDPEMDDLGDCLRQEGHVILGIVSPQALRYIGNINGFCGNEPVDLIIFKIALSTGDRSTPDSIRHSGYTDVPFVFISGNPDRSIAIKDDWRPATSCYCTFSRRSSLVWLAENVCQLRCQALEGADL